jgi:hypothetical protein
MVLNGTQNCSTMVSTTEAVRAPVHCEPEIETRFSDDLPESARTASVLLTMVEQKWVPLSTSPTQYHLVPLSVSRERLYH